jgi:hypothetical protein
MDIAPWLGYPVQQPILWNFLWLFQKTRLWEKESTEFDKLPDSSPFSDFNCDTNFQYKHKTAEAIWHSSPIGNLQVILLSQGQQLLIALLHHSHSVKTANCDKALSSKNQHTFKATCTSIRTPITYTVVRVKFNA